MKRVKIITILFISLFAFNVSALVDRYGNQTNGSTISLFMEQDYIRVKDGDTIITDYSEYLDINGSTILLKKDIDSIEIRGIPFTITTNNKKIGINDFYGDGYDYSVTASFDNAYLEFTRGQTYTYSSNRPHEAFRVRDYDFHINNSKIVLLDKYEGKIEADRVHITNSDVDYYILGDWFNGYCTQAIITNSNVKLYRNYGKAYLDNSTLNIEDLSGSIYATNMSKIITLTGGEMGDLIMDNSELEYKYTDPDLYYDSISFSGRFALHNSKVTLDFEDMPGDDYPILFFDNNNYEFDENMTFVDGQGRSLTKKTWIGGAECESISPSIMDEDYGSNSCKYYTAAAYVYEGKSPKSTTITSIVEVRLRVIGTWDDGTTDDIVLYKPAFSKLSYTDIPVGKMSLDVFENGDWDTKPVNAVLEENTNVVLTLTMNNKQGEVKGVDENPKTGVFNDILLFIPVIIFIVGFNYLKKFELFKKM